MTIRQSITLILFIVAVSLSACKKESPDQYNLAQKRQLELTQNLQSTLVETKNGWHLRYFPNVDSTLNNDVHRNLYTRRGSLLPPLVLRRSGVGGYNLFIQFEANGNMRYISDIPNRINREDANTCYFLSYRSQIDTSQYEIRVAEGLTLYFTLPTQLDQLRPENPQVNTRFEIVSHSPDKIVLRSFNYRDERREMIEMTPLAIQEAQWKTTMDRIIQQGSAFRNRWFTDHTLTSNLQSQDQRSALIIRSKASHQMIYHAEMDIAGVIVGMRKRNSISSSTDINRFAIGEFLRKNYALFIRNEQPDAGVVSSIYSGLGSGYIATEQGISFYPGLRVNAKVILRNFKKSGPYTWTCIDESPYEVLITREDQ